MSSSISVLEEYEKYGTLSIHFLARQDFVMGNKHYNNISGKSNCQRFSTYSEIFFTFGFQDIGGPEPFVHFG